MQQFTAIHLHIYNLFTLMLKKSPRWWVEWGGGGGGGKDQLVSFFPHPTPFFCSNDNTF